jgi:hypothetical protein
MSDRLSLSIFAIEADGKPSLAFRAEGLKPLYRFPNDALRHRDRQQASEKLPGKRRLNAKDG